MAPQAMVTKIMGKIGGAEESKVIRIAGASMAGCARKIPKKIRPKPIIS